MQLFEKMIAALAVNNTERVKKLVYKGAYYDRNYFETRYLAQSTHTSKDKVLLRIKQSYRSTYFIEYTPLAKAVEISNPDLIAFFIGIKKDNVSGDKRVIYNFQRHDSASPPYTNHYISSSEVVKKVEQGIKSAKFQTEFEGDPIAKMELR